MTSLFSGRAGCFVPSTSFVRVVFRITVAAFVFQGLAISSTMAAEKAAPLKGLLITGGCCHDYENQKRIITEGISQRVNIEWDVVHEGGDGKEHQISVYKQPGWASKYDVIFHNECFGAVVDDKFVQSIAAAHHEGVPAVFVHCSLHSYRNAPVGADAWRELIGVTSRSHEKKRPVDVVRLNDDHPVMKGFPEKWPSPNGELYKIERIWPNCIPLAQAWGEDTKQDHTVIWLNTFGNARVFGTSLGHHNETMNNDVWLDLVARGVLWSVDRLAPNGKPMPGYEGSGVKPIVIDDTTPPAPTPDRKFSGDKASR
ncbi:MAG: ThuA domain-containing protein [Planctomycetaceae bacterium]|nr:ThuA domain-containing protein [Planctomycetaceae bacterium]